MQLLALASLLMFSHAVAAGSVIGSRHDLSTPGTPQVCVFCHTPHSANTNIPGAPLWNRAETTQAFTLYGSATMNTSPAQPGTALSGPGVLSRFCLSCHDGVSASTVVHGNVVNTKHDLVKAPDNHLGAPDTTSQANCERCHTDIYTGRRRTLVIGTNLANDHPVAIPYPSAAQDPDFQKPPDVTNGWGGRSRTDIKLFGGVIECGSCHDVHNPDIAPFLRKSNAASALCLTCHKK